MGTKTRQKTTKPKSARRAPRSASTSARATRSSPKRKRQYEPGLYSASNGTMIGVIDANPPNNSQLEVWALSPAWAGAGPGSSGVGGTVALQSVRQGSPQSSPPWPTSANLPPSQKPANVFDVYCVENPPRGTTGTSTATPTRPQPVKVGQYKLFQSGKRVGELIVEPWGTDTRQHWFLCKKATSGGDAPYKAPSATSANSNTGYNLFGLNVNGINLATFEAGLGFGSSNYILAVVTFRTTVS